MMQNHNRGFPGPSRQEDCRTKGNAGRSRNNVMWWLNDDIRDVLGRARDEAPAA